MTASTTTMKIAILDDYQQVALDSADWNEVRMRAHIDCFSEPLCDLSEGEQVNQLSFYDVICCMRERMPFSASLLRQLPQLSLLITTGAKNAAIDLKVSSECGVMVCGTESPGHAASELAWALLMALYKKIPQGHQSVSQGLWQTALGRDLKGQTLGIIGLGRHGSHVARYAQAFGMRCIAWSQNLTQAQCAVHHVEYVDKETLFRQSDVVSLHLKMGTRNRNIVTCSELELMKPSAYLINTSRGAIVNEDDLIEALEQKQIGGAGLDVYAQEPLAKGHPLCALGNVLLSPHMGYVTEQTYEIFYRQTVEAVLAWMDGKPIRQIN